MTQVPEPEGGTPDADAAVSQAPVSQAPVPQALVSATPTTEDAGVLPELTAQSALVEAQPPDANVLAAVQNGLMSVPAGSPTSWFDVPSQRQRRAHSLRARRR